MTVLAGTSGYSYKPWKGVFYPQGLPDKKMLGYYAERLPTVEINNTFYRLPSVKLLESWAAQVPAGFRFSIKATRRITHVKRLKEAEDETRYLVEAVQTLGAKLGVLLFQLPPYLHKDVARLQHFLALLPDALPVALEPRHPSWLDPEVYELLKARNAALCLTDTDEQPLSAFTATASWGYLRLRRAQYSDDALRGYLQSLQAQPWEKAYVFFKHEDEGAGPRFATRLMQLAS